MAKQVSNINYKGINHSPSLVSDSDGKASECVNLSPDFNDLKPMPMPVIDNDYTVTTGCVVAHVHQGVGYENFLEVSENRKLLYFKDHDGTVLYGGDHYWTNGSEILSIQSIGNTLVVSTENGTNYFVFKDEAGEYTDIGERPPMPVIQFSLTDNNDVYKEESGLIDTERLSYQQDYITYPQEIKDDVDNLVLGLISTIEKRISNDSKFFLPFYVRYAYRTKTGDYIMQSPPVLMVPSSDKSPFICSIIPYADSVGVRLSVKAFTLQYYLTGAIQIDDWKDVISSIDVFVSNPVVNYDKANVFGDRNFSGSYYYQTEYVDVVRYPKYNPSLDRGVSYYDGTIGSIPSYTPDFGNVGDLTYEYDINSVNEDIIKREITSESLFYKVSSFDMEDINQGQVEDLPIENIANLTSFQTLEDDYNSHCSISASVMQTYNARLNMANISQKVFSGFKNGFYPQSTHKRYPQGLEPNTQYIRLYNVYYKIRKNGNVYTVLNQAQQSNGDRLDYLTYLYYPDPDCFEAVVHYVYNSTNYYKTITMKRHEYLNGSYWYNDMECLGKYIYDNHSTSGQTPPVTSTELWYDIPNRFMMSSVGNPWHFPVSNMFDIGRREIRALSINAENMNAPQYGQNPIYVFSADGIWTIAIKADGTFDKLSYVSGDVLDEMSELGSSPTASAEQVVFFKTSRGIMMVSGSATKQIDLNMKGKVMNPKTDLLPVNTVLSGNPPTFPSSGWVDLIRESCDNVPYADFVAGGSLIYDYKNARLVVLNTSRSYMYVYDVRHDFWSKMWQPSLDSSSVVMVGGRAAIQDTDGHLWYMDGQEDENNINARQLGFYVSRPMRFGTDDFKSLSRIVHNMQTDDDDFFYIALYGSRDGRGFYRVNTLRGTSYKFFVIVLYTYMLPSSRYAYTAFEWQQRLADKIR